jgi:hypothetical protein
VSQLESIGPDIWLADGALVDFYGFPYPTRMVAVRLSNGLVWVWSPIGLSANLRVEVDEIGRVAHLVSPNKIHHLYLADWKASYPAAKLWGPSSTIGKRTDLDFQAPLKNHPPDEWAGDFDQFWFTGSPFLDELVFLHKPSKTAILADLSENFSEGFLQAHWAAWQRTIARAWKIVEPWGYAPLELRLSWWRRTGARETLERLLEAHPERVVMAHGEWQPRNGRAYLETAFRWLR